MCGALAKRVSLPVCSSVSRDRLILTVEGAKANSAGMSCGFRYIQTTLRGFLEEDNYGKLERLLGPELRQKLSAYMCGIGAPRFV